jgi:hypothetical protein
LVSIDLEIIATASSIPIIIFLYLKRLKKLCFFVSVKKNYKQSELVLLVHNFTHQTIITNYNFHLTGGGRKLQLSPNKSALPFRTDSLKVPSSSTTAKSKINLEGKNVYF